MKTILLLHFCANAALIIQTVREIFFPDQVATVPKHTGTQMAWTGFFLAGLPIIAAAFWAVLTRTEAFVWLYFYYFVLTFILASIVILQAFVFTPACAGFKDIFNAGEAFACGIARAVHVGIVIACEGSQMYCIHVVWSYLEDMTCSGPELSDLIIDEAGLLLKRHNEDPLTSMVGYAEYTPEDYGSIYDVAADGGLGGSTQIFNGKRHEMHYPPPRGYGR